MNIAIIPARGGSKRIKNKNIRSFLGKPIISYPIKEILKSKIFDKVIVSTDNDKIANIAKIYGGEILFKRPKELSGDYSNTQEVIVHAINWIEQNIAKPKNICCIYPTSPLLKSIDLINSFKIFKTKKWDFLISATEFSYPIQRAFFEDKNGGIKMFQPKNYFKRSQDLTKSFHDAGQFYWGKYSAWLNKKKLFSKNSKFYKMPKLRVQDIDNIDDWKIAEKLYKIHYGKK